jgi:hypothetical protein
MVNAELFDQKVNESGFKFKYIAKQLGITEYGLIKKRKGVIPFKVNEINILTPLLNLTADERDTIFDLKSSK